MQHLFNRILPAIIPILVIALGTPLWQLGLLVSVFMFMGGLGQAPMGVIADRVDRQYLLIPSIALMSVGYLVFAFATDLGASIPAMTVSGHAFSGSFQIMVVAMAVVGLGFSGVHPTGYPLISANVSHGNKGKVLGMWASAAKVGDTATPLLIGLGILVVAWDRVLIVMSGFGLLYAIGLFLVLRAGTFETRPPSQHERDGDADRIAAELLANPRLVLLPLTVIVLFFFLIMFAGNGVMTFIPVFVSDVYGYTFSIAGVVVGAESVANFYFSALLLSGAVAQLLVGGLADVYDHRSVLIALVGTATVGLYILSTATLGPFVLLVMFVVLGGCIFGLYPARDALISEITPSAYEGRAFGYIFTIVMVGGSVFPIVIGYLADLIGIQASFGFLSLGSLLSLVCIGLLYSERVYEERAASTVGG